MGPDASSPLNGWSQPFLRYLGRGGAWESLCLLLAKRRMGGAGGRTRRFFPFAFRKRSGLHTRLGGWLRYPGPGARPAGGGRGGGGRGARAHAVPALGFLGSRGERSRRAAQAEERWLWSRRSRRRRGRSGGGHEGGGESLPPGEHGAPGAEAAAAGPPVAG